ncbi:hypothetical protein ES703_52137 [subsurface metagenome]
MIGRIWVCLEFGRVQAHFQPCGHGQRIFAIFTAHIERFPAVFTGSAFTGLQKDINSSCLASFDGNFVLVFQRTGKEMGISRHGIGVSVFDHVQDEDFIPLIAECRHRLY